MSAPVSFGGARLRLISLLSVVVVGTEPKAQTLHGAALQGDSASAASLLQAGANVNTRDASGRAPIHGAALAGHEGVTAVLLNAGANVDITDAAGYTPLMFASFRAHTHVVAKLLDNGADIERRDDRGLTALHVAAMAGLVNICRMLLQHGAVADGSGEIKIIEDKSRFTALHAAATHGHYDVAELLLRHRASTSVRDPLGSTPLHTAAAAGHTKVAALLLRHGASQAADDLRGYTALHAAAAGGHIDVVKLLLEQSSRASATTAGSKWDATPLHAAALAGHARMVALLIERGGEDIDAPDRREHETPLMMAVTRGHTEASRILLLHGASVSVVDKTGSSPLHGAASHGHSNIVALLIEHNAPIDSTDHGGATPLHAAIAEGHAEVAAVLVRSGARTDAQSSDGSTPVQLASDIIVNRFRLFLATLDASDSASDAAQRGLWQARLFADAGSNAGTHVSDEIRLALACLLTRRPRSMDTDSVVAKVDGLPALIDGFHNLHVAYAIANASATQQLFCSAETGVHAMDKSRLVMRLLHQLLNERIDTSDSGECRRVAADAFNSSEALNWDVPMVVVPASANTKSLSKQWKQWKSERALLRVAGDVAYTAEAHLADESALSSVAVRRIKAGPATLRQLLAITNQTGHTMNFISFNRLLAERLVPRLGALPTPLAEVAAQLQSKDKAVSIGYQDQTAFMHRHYQAFFTQTSGSKGWALAPPWYPRKLLEEARLTAMSDPVGGRRLCDLFRGGNVARDTMGAVPGLRKCVVRKGEILVVPGSNSLTNWWHGTCNLKAWNAGFTVFTEGAHNDRRRGNDKPMRTHEEAFSRDHDKPSSAYDSTARTSVSALGGVSSQLPSLNVGAERLQPSVTRLTIHPTGLPLLVIDNFLNHSAALIAEVTAKGESETLVSPLVSSSWEKKPWFPGWRRPLPKAYKTLITEALSRLPLSDWLNVALEDPQPHPSSMLTVTCTPPEQLPLFSRSPHHDQSAHMGHGQTIAMVHYVSRSWRGAPSGGTGMYRERLSGQSRFRREDCAAAEAAAHEPGNVSAFCPLSLSDVCARVLGNGDPPTDRDAVALEDYYTREPRSPAGEGVKAHETRMRPFCLRQAHGLASTLRASEVKPKYMGASDAHFELLHEVSYTWNRVILYDGSMLHSAHIDAAAAGALSCDPHSGRLAGSVFLSTHVRP